MNRRHLLWLIGLVVASLLTFGSDSNARELRAATAAPLKTPWGVWIAGVAKKVEQLSAGQLKMKVFYSSQLGDEQTVIRQVVRGRIDMTGSSNTATSLVVPEFALLAAPYLWDSVKQADCVFDNHVEHIYGELIQQSGLVLLGWVEVGQMILFNRTVVHTPADIKGKKVRIAPTKASQSFFDAIGANGVPLGTVDAMPALKTGNVNGATWPIVYGIAIGTHKMAPNVTLTKHSHQIGTLTISKKVWKTLSADERKWLREGFADANILRKGIRNAEAGLIGKIKKAGVPVYTPNAAEMIEWRKAGVQAQKSLVKALGGRAEEIWPKIVQAKNSCS